MRVLILKIGGGLVADKKRRYFFDQDAVFQIAEILSEFRQKTPDLRFLIGNGGGSFGHHTAKKYNLDKPIDQPEQTFGLACTHERVVRLNQMITKIFLEKGFPLFSFSPSSFLISGADGYKFFSEPVWQALREGLDVSFFGDCIFDTEKRARIFSTESLIEILVDFLLSKRVQIESVIQIGDTPGVFGADGKILPVIDESMDLKDICFSTSGADVTGGMYKKILSSLALARKGVKVLICGLQNFRDCLYGRVDTATVFLPSTPQSEAR